MKYDSGSGWPSFFQSFENVFETKLITCKDILEQNTIASNVGVIMAIFLMMDQNQLARDIATTEKY